jgi:hypothetical protein
VTFSASVCAHPDRLAAAYGIAYDLNAWITLDSDGIGSSRNHARAWRDAYNLDPAEFVSVVEDDAIPAIPIREHMARILAESPAPIVSGYLGSGRPPQYQPLIAEALKADPTWIIADELLHHVAVFVRRQYVPSLIAYLEAHPNFPCDEALSVWAQNNRLPVAYPIPSPFQHRDDEPVIRNQDRAQPVREARKAWRHGVRETWVGGRVVLLDQKTKNRYGHLYP